MLDSASRRLSDSLAVFRMHSAAALVRHGLRDAAPAIVSDLAALDTSAPAGSLAASRAADARTLTAIVRLWARGDGAGVLRAFDVWEVDGCEACADDVARGGVGCDACIAQAVVS